ncbi:hypothetical protein FGIG_07407, partial [Fasciola gigantica]
SLHKYSVPFRTGRGIRFSTFSGVTNLSYIRLKDVIVICHPVPQVATFSYPKMYCTGLVDGIFAKLVKISLESLIYFSGFQWYLLKNKMVAVWTEEADLMPPLSD